MKYFTIFLILIVLVNAKCEVKTDSNGKHCTACDECEAVCTTCDDSDKRIPNGEDCVCDPAKYYSKLSSSTDGTCVQCDEHCDMTNSGCPTHGKADVRLCDSLCEGHWSLITGTNDANKDYKCVQCHEHCDMTVGCKTAGKEVAQKCDAKTDAESCEKGYTLVKEEGKEYGTCEECAAHCEYCYKKGAGKCDPDSNNSHQGRCEAGYSLITEGDNAYTCVKCDEGCTSGCAVEGKTGTEGKCDTTCNTNGGYSFISESKICAKCDEHCDMTDSKGGCKEKGKDGADGFCDEKCMTGYKLDSSFHCIPICSDTIENCETCDSAGNEYKCIKCKDGYFLLNKATTPSASEKDKCVKIKCDPLDDDNCKLCDHKGETTDFETKDRNNMECIECESGYKPDYITRRCEKVSDLIKCSYKKEGSEEEKEVRYYLSGKCYVHHEDGVNGYLHYYAYENKDGKLMRKQYHEQDCEYNLQVPKTLDVTECTAVIDKENEKTPVTRYFKFNACSGEQKVYEYTDNTCTTKVTTQPDDGACIKVDEYEYEGATLKEYIKFARTSTGFNYYYEKTCKKADLMIYEDDDKHKYEYYTAEGYEIGCIGPCEIKNCDKCSEDFTTCESCESGYKLSEDKKKCEKQSDGGDDNKPENKDCNVEHCSECKDKDICTDCASGYDLKDNKCEKKDGGSNDDGDKCGSIMNIIMLTILIISLMI